jgi:hypothetical protein
MATRSTSDMLAAGYAVSWDVALVLACGMQNPEGSTVRRRAHGEITEKNEATRRDALRITLTQRKKRTLSKAYV